MKASFGGWPRGASLRGFIASAGVVMGTKLFDTVQTYNTPGTASLNFVAKQLHRVDLAAFGPMGNVPCNFPAGTEVGEALGVCITAGNALAALGIGTGPAQFAFNLQATDECALFTWDGAEWALVGKYVDAPALPFYAQTFANGDLTAGAIVITHGLASNFPGVVLYDDAGQMVPQGALWGVTRIDGQSFTLELGAPLLPISGSWGVGVSYT